jgi:hypothetical protein
VNYDTRDGQLAMMWIGTTCSAGTDFCLLLTVLRPELEQHKGRQRSAMLGVSFAGRWVIAIMVQKFVNVDREIFEL